MQTMLCSAMITVTAIVSAYFYKKASSSWGPRNCMIRTYPVLLLMTAFWWIVPSDAPIAVFTVPFILHGIMGVFYSLAMGHYFIISIPSRLQMPGTMLLFIIHGVIPGILGFVLNPLLHKTIRLFTYQEALTPYRIFFTIYVPFYIGCVILGKYMPKHLHQEAQ